VGYFGNCLQVGYFLLGIGNNFQKYATGLLVDGSFHGFQVGKVAQTGLHAKPQQCARNQRQRVAEKMARCDNGAALGTHSKQCIADGGHARVEGCHMGCSCQCFHPLLEVGHCGIFHTGIVGGADADAESIRHLFGVAKLVCHIVVYWYCQRTIGIGSDIRRMYCYRLSFQHSLHYLISLAKLHRLEISSKYLAYFGKYH